MRALYIFDLDGTLALLRKSRRMLLEDKADGQRWRKFYAACVTDLPNEPVIRTMNALRLFADVQIWSGRSSEVRAESVEWIANNTALTTAEVQEVFKMRNEGDYTPDHELKQSWLNELPPLDRGRLVATFDDRDQVVQMWRRNEVACFQVAPGDF